MGDFEGKTVIITGASAGVGAAAARAFAAQGANLVLIARGQTALEAIADELGGGANVLACQLDVADQTGCLDMLEKAAGRFGRIDVLVNNAGYHKRGPVGMREPEELARMVEVNLAAPVFLSRAVLPHFAKAGGGAIVNVASLAGMAPLPGAATYSATKFGLRAFSLALAEELRESGVVVSLVSPGPIDTGFIMDHLDEVEDITFSQPMSTAAQVAEVIVRAASASMEVAMPRASGILATTAYLFPALARRLRPVLARKGARVKARLKAS